MNPAFEFVLVVLFMVFAFTIIRYKMGIPDRSQRGTCASLADNDENARLREHVKRLQDRIQILERIVTDRGVETAAQIEALRERDQIGAEDKA